MSSVTSIQEEVQALEALKEKLKGWLAQTQSQSTYFQAKIVDLKSSLEILQSEHQEKRNKYMSRLKTLGSNK